MATAMNQALAMQMWACLNKKVVDYGDVGVLVFKYWSRVDGFGECNANGLVDLLL
jgi:hypothetical protein